MPLTEEQVIGMRKVINWLKVRLVDCETLEEVVDLVERFESNIDEKEGMKLEQELFIC